MENTPASCYVPVRPGSDWYCATYNDQSHPEFFYFPPGLYGHNWKARLFVRDGQIMIDPDDEVVVIGVPVEVMREFIRQMGV